jgi:hypothetical protein
MLFYCVFLFEISHMVSSPRPAQAIFVILFLFHPFARTKAVAQFGRRGINREKRLKRVV